MLIDLGYPFGHIDVPDGMAAKIVPAACHADDHFSHPFCSPGWEKCLAPGAVILDGPIYTTNRGWEAVVAIPS